MHLMCTWVLFVISLSVNILTYAAACLGQDTLEKEIFNLNEYFLIKQWLNYIQYIKEKHDLAGPPKHQRNQGKPIISPILPLTFAR